MENKREIIELNDIKLLVDRFYEKVRGDELLKDIFNEVIQDRWPLHLDKMYRFWQTVLLDEITYSGAPFLPHAKLPVDKQHFDRWLLLFNETVDELFIGEKAADAKWRAARMADMFLHKIEYFRNRPAKPLL
ncbi:hemoglobin [Parapedobacter composti]|uniref:Hemoglobin n=1 Tax=Parapedobacter composti TaxID=623281 RepID=A0A1I1L670_9SPHI|nr:group III truncated hemoglobin [Parapedobacter composti]SFC68445.1 hemoglobin [Parapedobacter composti]